MVTSVPNAAVCLDTETPEAEDEYDDSEDEEDEEELERIKQARERLATVAKLEITDSSGKCICFVWMPAFEHALLLSSTALGVVLGIRPREEGNANYCCNNDVPFAMGDCCSSTYSEDFC